MVCPRVIFFRNIYLKKMQESAILFNPPTVVLITREYNILIAPFPLIL